MKTLFKLFVFAFALVSVGTTLRNYTRETDFADENKKSATTAVSLAFGYDRDQYYTNTYYGRTCVVRLKPMPWSWAEAPVDSQLEQFLLGWSKGVEVFVLFILAMFAFKRTSDDDDPLPEGD